ncbi:MAG: glycosyltransferase family 4 protein [Patescibacteria group bacterium]
MSKTSTKIVLATGIFYPDVGGPAIHVRKIAEALHVAGYKPVVIAYGDYDGPQQFLFKVVRISNKLSPPFRYFKYLFSVLKEAINAKTIYAFNLSTAGLAVFIAGKLLRKKILIRVPGDPIWERTVESGKRLISFISYYDRELHKIDRPWLFKMIKFALPKFDEIIFYSPFLAEAYRKYYDVPIQKTHIILSPVFKKDIINIPSTVEPTMLFAGRFVAYKNLEMVIRVFDRVRQNLNNGRLLLVGDGPDKEKLQNVINNLPSAKYIEIVPKVNQEKLFEHICSSTFGIGPALTEFNPNFILECLSFGKPVLLSRENGLSVKLPEEFLFDPSDEKELAVKLEKFFDTNFYKSTVEKVGGMDLNQTWDKVINEHLKLLQISHNV